MLQLSHRSKKPATEADDETDVVDEAGEPEVAY